MNMKWLKRELAALTAAALTVESLGGIPAFAATDAPHTRSYDFNTAAIANPASVTESDLTAIFGEEWQGYAWQKPIMVDQGTSNDPKNTYRYDIVDKAFGKEPGDKAFRMWIDKNEKTNPDTDPMQKLMLTDGMDQNTNNAMVLKEGEYLDLSFDMAFSGEMGEKGLQAEYIGSFENTGRRYPIITGTNGGVKVLDQDVVNADSTKKVTLTQNSWYSFRLVMRAGDDSKTDMAEKNYFWFYIDNQLVNEGTFKPKNDRGESIDCFTGFNFYWFYQVAFDGAKPETATTYSERNLYLDNLKFVSSTEQPSAEKWSKTVSFNALTPTNNIIQAASALAENPLYWNYAGTRYQFDTPENQKGAGVAIKSGMFGKPQEDCFVDLYNLVGNEGDPTRFYRLGNVAESGSGGSYATNNQTLCSKVETGDFYELEFYSAWEENTIKQVQGYYAGEIEKLSESNQWGGATGKAEIMWIDQNGSVSVFGNGTPGVSLLPNKWYKFNVVVQNTPDAEKKVPVTLYIDNQKVLEASFLPQVDNSPRRGSLKDNAFSGFYALNFNNLTLVAPDDAAYKNTEHHAYFDDITVTNHKNAAPVYTAPQLVTGNETLENYLNGSLSGYTDSSVIYDKATWSLDGAPVTLLKADGSEVPSGSRMNDALYYFAAKDANGAPLYGMLKNDSLVLKETSFAADTNIGDYFSYGEKPYTVLSYENNGLAGKPSGDYYLKLTTTNAMSMTDPFLQITSEQAKNWDRNKPYHVEFSICLTEGFNQVNFQIIGVNDNEKERLNVISFNRDDNVYDHKGNVIGGYRMGEWNRVGISCYPASNRVAVRLNGKTVSDQALFTDASNRTSRFKLEQAFFDAKETSPMSAALMLDDFSMVQGSRQDAENTGITLFSSSSDLWVYDGGRVIFMKNDTMDMMEFAQAISGMSNATIRKVYEDDSLTAESMEIASGNVFLVSDGTYYNYYKLVCGEPSKVILRRVDGLSHTPGTYTVTAKTEFYHPFAGGTLILAQYDQNGVLISCATAEVSASQHFPGGEILENDALVYPADEQDTEISFTVKDAPGSTIKAFLLDENNVPCLAKQSL